MLSSPTSGFGCWALAMMGHAAVPAIMVINSRRFMVGLVPHDFDASVCRFTQRPKGLNVCYGSKPEMLATSTYFPLFIQ
jgi:hypothetical protein